MMRRCGSKDDLPEHDSGVVPVEDREAEFPGSVPGHGGWGRGKDERTARLPLCAGIISRFLLRQRRPGRGILPSLPPFPPRSWCGA